MSSFLNVLNSLIGLAVIASTLHFAVPFILASLGGTISERSGVVNIAMEGMMLMGAFFAPWVSVVLQEHHWPAFWCVTGAIVGAALAGGLISLVHAALSISFRANQIISGMAINLTALGVTSLLLITAFPNGTFPANYPAVAQFRFAAWTHIPVLSTINDASWSWFVPFAIVAVIAGHIVLFKTRIGLRIRAVGEHPVAAATLGVDVIKIRYACVVMSGILSGIGGAWFTMENSSGFVSNITSGAGYIALAAMIFGKWTPFGAAGASLLFAWGQEIYYAAPNIPFIANSIPANAQVLITMLPYLLTVIVLAGFMGRATPPAADGVPYEVKA